jgi:hypothetical protein
MGYRRSPMSVGIIAACLSLLVVSSKSGAAMAPDSYCQLAGQVGQKEAGYLQKVEGLNAKYCENARNFKAFLGKPKVYLDARAAALKEFNDAKAAVLAGAGVTAAEYAAFETANKEAIGAYLKSNPDVAADRLKAKVRVPSYCLLVIVHAGYKLQQFNEQMALAKGYSGTAEAFLTQEQAKQKEWDAKIDALFKLFDTSSQEYLTFPSKHGQAMKQYLEAHPAIKKAIDDLSAQVLKLLQQYEQAKGTITGTPKPEPPK